MQWRLQINRLQELIDQLECKVSGRVASTLCWSTSLESTRARHMLETWPMLCVPHRPPGWNPFMKRSFPRGPIR